MNEKCLSSECEKFMDGMNFTAEEFELSALLNQLMQGVSVSTLAAWASGGSCRTVSLFRDYFKLLNRSGINPMVDGSCFGRQCMLRLYSINTSSAKRLESRIKAAWLFSGGGKEMDASIERSEAANEEIVIFFFQLDLETRIQYALNTEQYDVAQQLRNKLNEVGTEIIKQQEAKRGSSRNDAQDKALNLLRLHTDMQKAIDNEKYAVAAELRDEISKLEVESLAASAKALVYENAHYAYRLGEKVKHKVFGYQAVICGMDPICCESSSWMEIANVDKLSQGPNQPFYQVLVDVHDDPNLLVAYVPEENLNATEKPDLSRFDHPYVSFLFYGTDTNGDFIPIKQLREKFNRPRHEAPMDMQDGSEEERIAELIAGIQPNERTGKRRKDIADYVQSLIGKCFPCQVFIFGSVPLMTYLPDGDIDLTVFSDNENSKDTWADKFYQVMKDDKKNENAEFHVKEVQLIVAEVKVIKCLVEDIVVDISFHQTGGLRALCFLEEMGHLINQDHLFKRSIILIKAWCYYESRILGAHHGLISTYALETMIVYIFHVFDNSFSGPLEVLYRFLEFFSNFDWENFCISIWGPVPLQLLPDIAVIPPRKNNGEFFPKKFFLESRSMFIDSLACDQHCQRRSFASKYFNVVDPLCAHNNLGRSVYKGNFHRICSAFVFGAKKLAKLLDLPKEEMIFELSQFFKSTWKRHRSGLHSSSPARMEHLKPYKSIQVGASNICMNISNEEQSGHISEDPVDVGLSFYGASSQILRMINQNSEDVSRRNGIQMAVCNVKKEKDCSSEIIIKSQDYVEKAFDSAKPVRTDKNHENLSYSNSNNIEEGDCRLQGQLSRSCSPKACFRSDPMNVSEVSSAEGVDIVQKSDTHEAFPVSSELDCSSKSLATGIMSSQAVTSIDDSICLNQNSSFQSTVSNAASHVCHDCASSTIETPSKMQSRYSYNEYPAQEMYRALTMVGNNEVPINETVQISNDDNIIATGQLLPSNPQQRAIPNSVVVPCTLYPTGPPVPFLEMLQTYNFPSYRSYYDGLYGLFDDETSNFDRNVNLCRMFAQPEIHDATPVKPILSHGLPHPNIPLLGLSSYAYPTVARNAYCRRIFPPIHPIRSILPQGTQLMPATCVLPEAQIRTYPSNPRVILRDHSSTTRHSWNYTHYGGNLDKGQQICIHRRPQAFWLANEPNHCFAPNYIQTAGSFDLCRSKEIAPHLGENGSIGSSNFSHVSTYMTQGMDYSQSSTAQASSSQHQRLMVEKNHRLKEENFPQ